MHIAGTVQTRPPLIGSNSFIAEWSDRAQRITSLPGERRYIALQPIFDLNGRVFGYEALHRNAKRKRSASDTRNATSRVIEDWLLNGLERLTDGKPVFLNCTREDLLGFLPLLPVSTVLEVLETVEADKWVEEACQKIKAFGHLIALDDFQLNGISQDLIKLADYIKVDFRQDDKRRRQEMMLALKNWPVRFIAEKIETREEFETAREEGFHLFQGYYLARPILLSRGRPCCSWLNYLRMRCLFRFRWSSFRLGRNIRFFKSISSPTAS